MDRPVLMDFEDRTIEVSRLYRDALDNPQKFSNPDSRHYLEAEEEETFAPFAETFENAMDAVDTRLQIVRAGEASKALEDTSLMGIQQFYDAADGFLDLERQYAEQAQKHGVEYTPFAERIDGYPEEVEDLLGEIEDLRDQMVEERDYDFLRGY